MSNWYPTEGTSPPPPPPHSQPPGRKTSWLPAIIAGIWVVAAVSVLAAVIVIRSGDDEPAAGPLPTPNAVRLEPVTYTSPAPFTTSVATMDLSGLSGQVSASVSTELPAPTGSVTGDAALLYATSAAKPACDKAKLAQKLRDDAAVGTAWATASGVEPDAIESLLATLTPVVLRADTAVTNHVYTAGEADSYQSVLEAGTPVMVDPTGLPRVQCSCGNPLLAPEASRPTKTDGERWKTFDAAAVVSVGPAPAPVPSFQTVDLDTSKPATTATGSNTVLDGTLVASTDGLHVATPDGQLVKVLDKQVDAVFDDGRGGIVYTLAEPGNEYHAEPPATSELSTIWHLPAGQSEPVALVPPEQSGRWNVLEAVGSLGGRTFVAYGSMYMSDGSDGVEPTAEGSLVARDLVSGAGTTLVDQAYGWESGIQSVSFGGDRLAVISAAEAFVGWTLFGPGPAQLPSPCAGDGMIEFDDTDMLCPDESALDESGKLVGIEEPEDPAAPAAVVWTDPVTGEKGRGVALQGPRDPDTSAWVTQVGSGRLVTWSSSQGVRSWKLYDIADGAPVELPPVNGEVQQLWMLTAPLIRPKAAEPAAPPTTAAYRPVTVDELRAGFPSSVCGVEAGPVPIGPKGYGESGADPSQSDFVSIAFTDEAVITDVDGDGADETVVAPTCSWGGSHFSTPLAALRMGANGIEVLGQVFEEFARGSRAIEHLSTVDGGVEVSGGTWVGSDAMCCPSQTFTARLRFVDGRWQEG